VLTSSLRVLSGERPSCYEAVGWRSLSVCASLFQVNTSEAVYRHDLAVVHHRGFGFHAAACAPGILGLLAPVHIQRGLVLELGCGTGLLTKELVAAGHRVLATDASLAMLDVARELIGDRAEEVRQLTLPDDPLPSADAIVASGHPLNYLPDAGAIDRALIAIAGSLRPGGLLALDICDLEWGRARREAPNYSEVREDWAIITRYSMPTADRFVRDITTFLPNPMAPGVVIASTTRTYSLTRHSSPRCCVSTVSRRRSERRSALRPTLRGFGS